MLRTATRTNRLLPPHQGIRHALALKQLPSIIQQRFQLSTSRTRLNDNKHDSSVKVPHDAKNTGRENSSASANEQIEPPKFSLKDLGLSKNMKILMYVLVGILGTMETITYTKMIHRWWYGEEGGKSKSPDVVK